ncbi:MAG: DNA internalization-related competence protein ComEC/Rec2 [Halieaceae bacterium]|nr:DNA internalization-related competence protein ComEC/Rec2 [Halieaceae bacterium]
MTRFAPKDYAVIVALNFIFGVLVALLWREFEAFYVSLCLSGLLLYFFRAMALRLALFGWCVGQFWVWVYGQWLVELSPPSVCLNNSLTLQAKVRDFVDQYPGYNDTTVQRVELDIVSVSAPDCAVLKRIRVYYTGPRTLSLGDRIIGRVTLRPERGFANFSSDKRKAQAVALQRLATGRLEFVYSQQSASRGFDHWRYLLAQRIRNQADLSETAKGVIAALVVADKRYIPDVFQQTSLRLGVGHVLVISGLHIALVAGLAGVMARTMLRPLCWFVPFGVRQYLGDGFVLVTAMSYALLAGLSLPTQRAVLTLGFWLLAKNLGRDGQPFRLFGWALVICLAANPFSALLPAFWLSFGAVFMVLTSSAILARFAGARAFILGHVAICVAMWPTSLVFFGQASVLSIPANIVAVPVASLWLVPLSLLGTVALLLGFSGANAALWSWAALPLDLANHLLDATWLTLGVWQGAMPIGLAILLSVLWILLLTPLRPVWRAVLMALVALMLSLRSMPTSTDKARLWVFDVGQGSSMLLQVAGQSLLFDMAGGLPGRVYHFDYTAAPILHSLNITSLDTIVLSHQDFDHVGGFYSPNFNFGWRRLVSPDGNGEQGQFCRPGLVEHWGPEVSLQWLSGGVSTAGSDNDSSCVLKVNAYGHSVLFMADVGKQTERDLVSYWREELAADILIVGHHGSDTSTSATLLKWAKPRYAVISAGFNNAFGHPSPAVIKRLNIAGATILNTSHTGALRFEWGRNDELHWLATRARWARFWQDNYSS